MNAGKLESHLRELLTLMSAQWQIPPYREIAIVEAHALNKVRSDWLYTISHKSSKPLKLSISSVVSPAEYSEHFDKLTDEGRDWIRMSLVGLAEDYLLVVIQPGPIVERAPGVPRPTQVTYSGPALNGASPLRLQFVS